MQERLNSKCVRLFKNSDVLLDHMTGIMQFNLNKGEITELGKTVEGNVGLGVLINILSLQSLFKTLSLDLPAWIVKVIILTVCSVM